MRLRFLPVIERLTDAALRHRGFESRRVPTTIGELHIYDGKGGGELPTIVVLHGIGSSSVAFGRLLLHLQRHARRVVALDLPGHGWSGDPQATLTPRALFDAVDEALDAVVPEPLLLFGNSLGGAIALRYGARCPARVRALLLASPAGARSTPHEWRSLLSSFDMRTKEDARRFVERLYHRPPWLARVVAPELSDVFQRKAVRDLLENAEPEDVPSEESLRGLPMPVLLLWGSSERLLPESYFDYFRRTLPSHAVIERFDGVGHCPHLEDPARLAKRVVSFARQC